MRVLVTGHNGYIGSVMVPMLQAAGHQVTGLDTYLYSECTFGPGVTDVPALRVDLRDVTPGDLRGFDAVIHLAALCNDPLGNLNPDTTYEINHRASVRLARAAKEAGVPRWLFASSCSLYGLAGDDMLTEEAGVQSDNAVRRIEDPHRAGRPAACRRRVSSPTYLRNATAYGVSPRLRGDIVVNNLVGYAFTSGRRPDSERRQPVAPARAYRGHFARLPRRARRAARGDAQPGIQRRAATKTTCVSARSPTWSRRSCRAALSAMRRAAVPIHAAIAWTAARSPACCRRSGRSGRSGRASEQLYAAYRAHGLTRSGVPWRRYFRIRQIQKLQDEGRLGRGPSLERSRQAADTGAP